MSNPSILALLFGNSHANCMVNALRAKAFPTSTRDFAVRVVTNGSQGFPGGLVLTDSLGRRVVNPVITRAIQQAVAAPGGRQVWLLSVIGGNHGNRMGLFRSGEEFDVILPGDGAPLHGQARLVPYDAVCTTLEREVQSLREFFALIPRGGVAGIAHLEGPPPTPSAQFIIDNLPDQTRQMAAQYGLHSLDASTINPPELRHKIWQCQSAVMRRVAEAQDVLYLLPPTKALDAEGRRRMATCKDAMHGTTEYGVMCLESVRDALLDAASRCLPAEEHS